jgi:DNA polymerase-1
LNDEVIVHTPVERTAELVRAIEVAGEHTRLLLFGDTPVRFPLGISVVDCYADAK